MSAIHNWQAMQDSLPLRDGKAVDIMLAWLREELDNGARSRKTAGNPTYVG